MIIPEDILFQYGAVIRNFVENEIIFREGSCAKQYYQVQEGTVKISSIFDDGKEFVHGFQYKDHCFGESYLFTEKPYIMNATALTSCSIICLTKFQYYTLLRNNPEILLDVNRYTADRLHFRYMVASFLVINDPMIKTQKLLDYLKDYFGYSEKYSIQVPYTRYQLASLTGLRVETLIRTVKKMEGQKLLKIVSSKIYY